jgi:hypothetical protein
MRARRTGAGISLFALAALQAAWAFDASAGVVGVYFVVTVARPDHGLVTSTDGRINCGPLTSVCSAQIPWSQTATLNAAPDPGYGFQQWAGDCGTAGPCVLTAGADKYVVPVFRLIEDMGHPNWSSYKLHGPPYLDYLASVPGTLNCKKCHGLNLQGQGIAPNCFSCHAQAGWTSWQTNCSFCHGARTAAAKAGYAVADHPEWSAPPDAVSQRIDGTAAPARSGAHRAHLTGVSASGARLSAPFRCETCHVVPTNLSHVGGSASRATVTLSPAGQGQLPATLGTYDQTTGTCTTYCHGAAASPPWGSGPIACGSCHAVPPPAHVWALSGDLAVCSMCQSNTMSPDGSIELTTATHVNGDTH